MKRLIALIVAVVATLTGCIATPLPTRSVESSFPVSEGFANVFFLREPVQFGSAVWPAILLNGQRVAPLPNGTFTVVKVKPGSYEITMEKEQWSSGSWTGTTRIDVQPGKNYYLLLQLLYRNTSGLVLVGPTPIFTREAVSEGQRWSLLEERAGASLIRTLPFVDPFVIQVP